MSSSPTAPRPAAPAPQGAPGAAMSRTAEIRLVAGRELRAQLLKKSTLISTGVMLILVIGVIVAASRMKHPLDARTLARLAASCAGDGPGDVVGFGLSNDERVGSTASFAPAFRIARRAGLVGVPHGGELLGPASVREVVASLAPARIGHGVRTSEDPDLLKAVVDAGIALEVCPTSNVHLGVFTDFSHVPLPTLIEAGARIALAADDPLLFRSRLVAQYEVARDVFGLSDEALADLARSSIDASLASPTRKAAWKADIDAWLAAEPAA